MNRLASHINTWLSPFTYSLFEFCHFISNCLNTTSGIQFLHLGGKPEPRTPSCIACPLFVTFIPRVCPRLSQMIFMVWFLVSPYSLFTTSSPLRGVVWNQHVGAVHTGRSQTSTQARQPIPHTDILGLFTISPNCLIQI